MRRPATTAAAIALAIGIYLLSTGVSGVAKTNSGTIHITAKTLMLTGPTSTPRPGDHLEFYEGDTGSDTGRDYFDCVVTNKQGATYCNAEFVLRHGDITIAGVLNINSATVNVSGPITGGTGRYAAARGSYKATGTPTATHFAFHFES